MLRVAAAAAAVRCGATAAAAVAHAYVQYHLVGGGWFTGTLPSHTCSWYREHHLWIVQVQWFSLGSCFHQEIGREGKFKCDVKTTVNEHFSTDPVL